MLSTNLDQPTSQSPSNALPPSIGEILDGAGPRSTSQIIADELLSMLRPYIEYLLVGAGSFMGHTDAEPFQNL